MTAPTVVKNCVHDCGSTTIRRVDARFNTFAWIKWAREHGLPVGRVVVNGGLIVRNERDKQVVALVFDWRDGDDIHGEDNPAFYLDRDATSGNHHVLHCAFVSQLDRVPAPFPTEVDCSDDREGDFSLNGDTGS